MGIMVDHASFFFNNEKVSIDEIYSWLCGFINLEQGLGGSPASAAEEHFKLDRIRYFAAMADHPETCAPVIHIAGSKGKGSVTAMITEILGAAGKNPARYMSPHVYDFRERIGTTGGTGSTGGAGGGGFFPEVIYGDAGKELRQLYADYTKARKPLGEPTFFELCTLFFFLAARRARCDVLVVETGLGGRLDATNIVTPLVSVITVIEKEHTRYLGDTLEKIAFEKAGIIKTGKPVIAGRQKSGAALEVLRKTAASKNAPFVYLDEKVRIGPVRVTPEGTLFCLSFGKKELEFLTRLPGGIQAENGALAILAARTAFPGTGEGALRRGLARANLPARFEKLLPGPLPEPLLVADGAHTPASVSLCAETFRSLYGSGGVLVFGCAEDKDAAAMARILLPDFSRCIITSPGSFRASSPGAVYEAFRLAANECNRDGNAENTGRKNSGGETVVELIPETAGAVQRALAEAGKKKLPVLACGSFYLAAAVKKALTQD